MPDPYLENRLNEIALRISDVAAALPDQTPQSKATLENWAYELSGMAAELIDNYVYLGTTGDAPTVAQGVALARFLRPSLDGQVATISKGGQGLPPGYLYVRFSDGYCGGIAPDGRTST